jgi:nucleoside-diphosphate-sugar epimerase
VVDVTEASIRATRTRGTFNIATGIETPVSELFEILTAAAGSSIEPIELPLREGELERSCLDTSHASEVLEWEAKIALDEGLKRTYHELVAEFEAREPASRS